MTTMRAIARSTLRPLVMLAPIALALLCVTPADSAALTTRSIGTLQPITLVSQDLALNPQAPLPISFHTDRPLPADSTIVVTAYQRVQNRIDLASAINGKLPRALDTVDVEPSAISTGTDGVTTITIPTETSTRTSGALQFAQQGLYPLVVDVRSNSDVIAELTTFVDRLGTSADEPLGALNVSVAASITAPPEIPGAETPLAPAVTQALADLTSFPKTVPLSLAISPELLDRVDTATRDNLRQAFNGNLTLSLPRVPLDPSAAAAAGQEALFTKWLREGENTISSLDGTPPSDRSVWLSSSPLTTAGASLLRNLGTRMLVLQPDEYAAAGGSLGAFTDTTQLLQTQLPDNTVMPTMVIDPVLADRLDNSLLAPEQAALFAAADLVATRDQLAAVAAPVTGHSMVIGLKRGGVPNPTLLARVQSLIAPTGAVDFVTFDSLERSTTTMLVDGLAVQIVLGTTPPMDLSPRLVTLGALSTRATTVAGMLVTDGGRPARWNETIDVLTSTALTDSEVNTTATSLSAELDAIIGAVSPRPAYAFTLSGRRTTIRIRLENSSAEPLRVLVRMSSTKLTFPKGDQAVQLEPNGVTDVAVPVIARSNGSFPVSLDVLTPDGTTSLGATQFLKARVSALTGLAQLLTGGLLLVLLTWWVRHMRTTRRKQRHRYTKQYHPAAQPGENQPGVVENSANLADS